MDRGERAGVGGGDAWEGLGKRPRRSAQAPRWLARMTEAEHAALMVVRRAQRRLERGVEFGYSYASDFILSHPLRAQCAGCGYLWVGRDAIRSPNLLNCSCFWCHGELVTLDLTAYEERLKTLHLHRVPYQVTLQFDEAGASLPCRA